MKKIKKPKCPKKLKQCGCKVLSDRPHLQTLYHTVPPGQVFICEDGIILGKFYR